MKIASKPNQKVGSDSATIAAIAVAWSRSDPRFTADRTPIATPIRSDRHSADPISSKVAGSRSNTTSRTGCPPKKL